MPDKTSAVVTYVHRPKPPPRKKPVAPDVPAVVRQTKPDNDNRPEVAPQPAIVTTTSRKRAKLLRAERRATEPDDDPEAEERVKAFFAPG